MINPIISIENLLDIRSELKQSGKRVVFTNGCFDILHAGHVDYLTKAKELGEVTIGVLSEKVYLVETFCIDPVDYGTKYWHTWGFET